MTPTVNLSDLAGTFLSTSTLTIPANGQTAKFLNQLPGFESVADIEGVLQITTDAINGLSVVGRRAAYWARPKRSNRDAITSRITRKNTTQPWK